MNDKKVIIVEDEPIIALDFQFFLINKGYTNTTIFYSGGKAIKNINQEKPDLALLDIRLQDSISGLDVAEVLKGLNVPFIFISAFSDKDNYQKAVYLNPVHIFYKPVDKAVLLNAVENIFEDSD